MQTVRRIRDGKVCAYFEIGGVSPVEFLELLAEELGAEHGLQESRVYCEFWRLVRYRGKRAAFKLQRCDQAEPEAFPVTGIDVVKWDRG